MTLNTYKNIKFSILKWWGYLIDQGVQYQDFQVIKKKHCNKKILDQILVLEIKP